ncbi:hypothetical protein [Alicyclobacillus ferrooxydans]|uniref:hypothetical protein n=1 Tax=Alicyclobacillus ferrooxydans TaxID=471514 RepID=UPI0006D56E22|nr:hypothetical protein [Alicyclobacillus ferrooxydans]
MVPVPLKFGKTKSGAVLPTVKGPPKVVVDALAAPDADEFVVAAFWAPLIPAWFVGKLVAPEIVSVPAAREAGFEVTVLGVPHPDKAIARINALLAMYVEKCFDFKDRPHQSV